MILLLRKCLLYCGNSMPYPLPRQAVADGEKKIGKIVRTPLMILGILLCLRMDMETRSGGEQPDCSLWPTKKETAEAIGVSTKLVEQFANEKRLQVAKRKQPGTGAWASVYHPDDVERIRKERNPEPSPFVIQPAANVIEPAAKAPEPAKASIAPLRQSPAEFLQALAAAVGKDSQNSERCSVRTAERIFLTVPEAADYSGLPQAHLRRLMADGRLSGLKTGAGWRIRRADLEKL